MRIFLTLFKGKSLSSQSLIYLISSLMNGIMSYLLLIYLTSNIAPDAYGKIDLAITIAALTTVIVLFGGNTLINKNFYREDFDAEKLIGSILGISIQFALAFILFLFLIYFIPPVREALNIPLAILVSGVAVGICNAVVQIRLVTFQVKKNAAAYLIFLNSRSLIEIACTILLISIFLFTWDGRVISLILGAFIFSCFSLWSLNKNNYKIKLWSKYSPLLLKQGGVLTISALSSWIILMVDRLMINSFLGTYDLGVFAATYKLAMIILLIQTAVSYAWNPFFYQNINIGRKKNKHKIVSATYFLVIFLALITIVGILIGNTVIKLIFDVSYFPNSLLFPLLCLAFFFDGIWKLFTGYFLHTDRVTLYALLGIFIAFLNFILNLILIPKIGYLGAAYSSLFSLFIGSIVTIYFGTSFIKMPWIASAKLLIKKLISTLKVS